MSRRLHFSLLLSAVGCLASAGARDLQDLNSTKDGKGRIIHALRVGNLSVERVRVTLRRGGSAEIQLMSGVNQTFYGQWRNAGAYSCRITIERLGGDRATGRGTVTHDQHGSFRNIELNGSSRGAKFEFNFHADKVNANLLTVDSARDGYGSLEYRSKPRSSDVARVRVSLRRGGEFEVRIEKGINETWRGTWSDNGRNRVRLEVNHIGRDAAAGSGMVDLDGRGSFDRVNLSGTGGGARFNFDFRANSDQGPPTDSDFRPFSINHTGTGSFAYDGATRRTKSCRIDLSSNGTFRVSSTGDGFQMLSGRWRIDGARVRLEVDAGLGSNTDGSGTVDLTRDRRDWTGVTINGSGRNGKYTFYFRA